MGTKEKALCICLPPVNFGSCELLPWMWCVSCVFAAISGRTGVMIACYLAYANSMHPGEAVHYIRTKR